ncbi:hypothetical protein TNCV_4597531 [Trichonephila clavipes]|nr:hypothetical protein TNCV_4597531 [Trichonephila clavipes]
MTLNTFTATVVEKFPMRRLKERISVDDQLALHALLRDWVLVNSEWLHLTPLDEPQHLKNIRSSPYPGKVCPTLVLSIREYFT